MGGNITRRIAGEVEGVAPVAQTFSPDTSADPQTVTLPDVGGLPDGYIVRVVDAQGNASVNNITINDAEDAEVTVIDEDDGERYLVVAGGAWEVRGYLPAGAAQTYLSDIAIAAGATHCWLGRDDPHADLVGTADLVDPTGQRQIPPLPAAVEGVLISNPNDSGRVGVSTAAGAVTLHRNADRTFTWLFHPDVQETWGDCNLLGLGAYNDADGLVAIRATAGTGLFASAPSFAATGAVFGTIAAVKGKTCLLTGRWVAATQTWTFWISIDGAAEVQVSGTDTTTRNSGTAEVWLGYANNTYADHLYHMHLALYDGDASAVRLEMYTALGWADA